jgi:hypothetical protein
LDLKQYVLVFNKVMERYMASGKAEEEESNKYLIPKRKGFNDLSKNSGIFAKL